MKKIITVLLGIAVICCAGCGVDERILNYEDEPSNYNTGVKKAENGYYFVDILASGRLRYHDLESGVTVPLCNKPECDHDTESCISGYIDDGFAICGDYIYYATSENSEEFAEVAIYQIALDGSSRTKLATGCSVKIPEGVGGGMQFSHMVVHKGKLIFTYDASVGNSLRKQGISEYDLSTGKITEIMSTSADSFNVRDFIGLGDCIYFAYDDDLMKYDMNTKELSAIYKEKCSLLRSDGEYLYSYRAGYIWKIDPVTGEEIKLVHKGKNYMYCGTFAAYKGYLLVYNYETCGFTVYDENDNTILTTNVSDLVKSTGTKQLGNPMFEVGVENGELIIIADGYVGEDENAEYVNLIFGCNFENYINKTETPKLIFTAKF